MTNKKILILIFVVAFLTLLIGCLPGLTPPPPKGVISGRIMVPSSETTKDITGWIPVANATVTLIDSGGITRTVTTDEDGYYTFTNIAVNANTIITATAAIDGNTVIVKDVIPQAVAADEDYNAKTADAESTALALIVEEMLEQGFYPGAIDLEEIQGSANFTEVVEQVTSVLEENGNVTTDHGLTFIVGSVAEDIISPPVYILPEETPEPEYTPPPVIPAVNHPPIITSTQITTATVGIAYTYDVEATDPDGDTLTYSLTDKPSSMTINSATGVINWIPTSTQEGNNPVTIKVDDGALSDTQSFTIKVSEPSAPPTNHVPIITPISDLTIIVDEIFVCEVGATDPDNDTLIYFLITKPDGMLIDENSGVITWTPTAVGSFDVTVKVSDGELSDTQSFMITVVVTVIGPIHNTTQGTYYNTIQVAIDYAKPGEAIEVAAGTYNEEVNIDKPLTLLGEDKYTTIIDGGGVRFGAIDITADYVTVSGFTIQNRGHSQSRGITVEEDWITHLGGHNCEVSNNVVDAGEEGIRVNTYYHSGYNVIEDNIITGDWNGIQLWNTLDNTVTGNTITSSSGWAGINLGTGSDNNTIMDNIISDCKYGMSLVQSGGGVSGNIISHNTISGCERGIWWQRNPANTIENNNILDNTEYNLYASYFTLEAPAPAEYNWWGADPPDITKFFGQIDYEPYSTSLHF